MTLEAAVNEVIVETKALNSTVSGKMGEIDNKVDESIAKQEQLSADSKVAHEQFMANADSRYIVQTSKQSILRVDGDQNYWYPVLISNPDGNRFVIRREVHTDRDFYGSWNGSLEFHFRAADSQYGGAISYFSIDRYQVSGKSSSRLLPDSDIPYIGRFSVGHGPYDCVIWLRGNTTYLFYSENSKKTPTVYYEEFETTGTYPNVAPIPVSNGVDAGLPEVGYVKGA